MRQCIKTPQDEEEEEEEEDEEEEDKKKHVHTAAISGVARVKHSGEDRETGKKNKNKKHDTNNII